MTKQATGIKQGMARLAAAALGVTLSGSLAVACAFHTYIPQDTVVDWMLGSDHIVLARVSADNPAHFQPVAALRGSAEQADIPFEVDEQTRQRLAQAAEDTVLFARDGAYGPWRRLAYLDPDYRDLIDFVGTRLDDWELGGDMERFQTFAALHDHTSMDLRDLALRELDRAPYEILRVLDLEVDAPGMFARLDLPDETEYRPIRLLMLGLSGDDSMAPALRAGLERARTPEPPAYLGAYATALIELVGISGSADVETLIRDESLPIEVREQLIEALAIHAFSDPEYSAALAVRMTPDLLEDVALAAAFARQFGIRGDWSFRTAFADLLDTGTVRHPYDLITLTQYVAIADQSAALE